MPSPIAHISIAWLIWKRARIMLAGKPWVLSQPAVLFLGCVGFSLLPDVDFLPGILARDLKGFHNSWSHSLLVALALATVVGAAVRLAGQHGGRSWFFISLAGYATHILMDALTWGRGVMLFWPLTTSRFRSPYPLFHGLHWSEGWLSREHLFTLLNETIFVLLIILSAHILTRFMRTRQTKA